MFDDDKGSAGVASAEPAARSLFGDGEDDPKVVTPDNHKMAQLREAVRTMTKGKYFLHVNFIPPSVPDQKKACFMIDFRDGNGKQYALFKPNYIVPVVETMDESTFSSYDWMFGNIRATPCGKNYAKKNDKGYTDDALIGLVPVSTSLPNYEEEGREIGKTFKSLCENGEFKAYYNAAMKEGIPKLMGIMDITELWDHMEHAPIRVSIQTSLDSIIVDQAIQEVMKKLFPELQPAQWNAAIVKHAFERGRAPAYFLHG